MSALLSVILAMSMQAAAPSNVEIISREMMSQVDEPAQAVARTPAEWSALWKKHAGGTTPPAVDFTNRTVVAVFLGSRSTAGFAVDITSVRQENGTLIVEWQERRPSRDEVSAQILTSPSIIATVPKFAGPITFQKAGQ